MVVEPTAGDHVGGDEAPEDGHAPLEGDAEGDVVEDAEARREVRNLALGERALAGRLGKLLFLKSKGQDQGKYE